MKPGDYRINFGRWQNVKLKHMSRNDVEWVAHTCTAFPEASEMAREYIREHPEEFPSRRSKGKMR